MTYSHLIASSGGRTFGLWRPNTEWSLRSGASVLLLGRTPAEWAESAVSSAVPQAFVEHGAAVITVATPGWGNATDLASIDAALAWGAGFGAGVERVIVVAVDRGAVPAANWGIRHHERISAMHLVAPVVDLTERYARVTADQAAIDAAHGGTLATVANEWDPGKPNRRHQATYYFGDRATVWSHPDDPDTPAAVTDGLATKWQADTRVLPAVNPLSVPAVDLADAAVVLDAAWAQQPAAVQQRRWHELGANAQNPIDTESDEPFYRYGDRHPIPLPGTDTVLWTLNDVLVGSMAPGDLVSALPFRNGLLVEDTATGEFTQPVGRSGGAWLFVDQVKFPMPAGIESPIYWPMHGVVENGLLRVCATLVGHRTPTNNNAELGDHLTTHIVDVDLETYEYVDAHATGLSQADMVPVTELNHWGDYIYVQGQKHDPPWSRPEETPPPYNYYLIYEGEWAPAAWNINDETQHRLARVPYGQLTNPAAWEYHTGTGWSDDPADLVSFHDVDGNLMVGDGSVARADDGWYVYVCKNLVAPDLEVYRGPNPWGPWKHRASIPVPGSGAPLYPGDETHSMTLWQKMCPHIPTPPGTMMATCQLQTAGTFQSSGAAVLLGNAFFVCPTA